MVKGSSYDSIMGSLNHPILVLILLREHASQLDFRDRSAARRRVAVSLFFTLASEGLIVCYHHSCPCSSEGSREAGSPIRRPKTRAQVQWCVGEEPWDLLGDGG